MSKACVICDKEIGKSGGNRFLTTEFECCDDCHTSVVVRSLSTSDPERQSARSEGSSVSSSMPEVCRRAKMGDVKGLQFFLRGACDPNTAADNGMTPLHFAAFGGHRAACMVLLAHRADPDVMDKWKDTGSERAKNNGHAKLAAHLKAFETNAGMPWAPQRHRYFSPAHQRCVLALLSARSPSSHGPNPDGSAAVHLGRAVYIIASFLPGSMLRNPALLDDASSGNTEAVAAKLRDQNCDPKVRGEWGNTSLHHAASAGHFSICELLLKHRAEVDARGENIRTPLHMAAQHGHDAICHLLVEHGADIGAHEGYGVLPQHLAAKYAHGKESTCLRLLELGAHVKAIGMQRSGFVLSSKYASIVRKHRLVDILRYLEQADCQRCASETPIPTVAGAQGLQSWLPCRCVSPTA